jgi:hypothetical protein
MKRLWDDVLWPLLSFITLIVFLCTTTKAAECQDSVLDVVSDIKAHTDQSIEYAAVIIRKADGSVINSPLVQGSNDTFKLTIGLHKGDSLCALVHSHPGTNHSASLFSAPDVAMAIQLNVVSYIYIVARDSIRVFTPNKDSVTLGHNGADTANGRIINLIAKGV